MTYFTYDSPYLWSILHMSYHRLYKDTSAALSLRAVSPISAQASVSDTYPDEAVGDLRFLPLDEDGAGAERPGTKLGGWAAGRCNVILYNCHYTVPGLYPTHTQSHAIYNQRTVWTGHGDKHRHSSLGRIKYIHDERV